MLLRQQLRTPIWPYVAVVACLFLLSILASRSWRGQPALVDPASGRHAAGQPSASVAARPAAALSTVPAHEPVESEMAGPVVEPPALDPAWPDRMEAEPPQPELTQVLTQELVPQTAASEPAVTQDAQRDISVTETPALPVAGDPMPPAPIERPESSEPPMAVADSPAVLEKSDPPAAAEIASVFPFPRALIASYGQLQHEDVCQEWSNRSLILFEKICHIPSMDAAELPKLLADLSAQSQAASELAAKVESLRLRAEILRTGYATQRRAEIWTQVHKIVTTGRGAAPVLEPRGMLERVTAVEKRLESEGHLNEWRDYLLLNEITKGAATHPTRVDRELARRVLRRMNSPELSEHQAEILRQPPFDAFRQELRLWTNEPIDYLRVLDDLEVYETAGTIGNARPISRYYDALRWSSDSEIEKLAELINTHYRNSNVRVAMTGDFMNRLLPGPQQIEEDVADNISGAQVYGTSRTLNQLKVVLVPDQNNLRIGLEAVGEVASDTAASKGPATFYNQGFARYHVRKLLLIDRRGMRVWRAEGEANSESELTGFETEFDALPLIGWLARSMARQQHDDRYFETKAETDAKLERHATERFDAEVHERLSKAENQVQQKLIQPFANINLQPTPIDLQTTEQRIIARYRLAGETQLGSHTPRPQAPGDSLLSAQIHESAMNNTLSNLNLEGKRISLRDLYQELAETFARPDFKVPEEVSEDVIVQFAETDAVRVKCDNGRVTMTIRIKELKSGRARWTDFAVRAYYVPDSQQLTANLVRDGGIELVGERLGERLPLRVIFNKVLSKDQPFNLINKKLSENPNLQDLHVNQFVINDGWIGVAVGPNRAGQLDHFAREKADVQPR